MQTKMKEKQKMTVLHIFMYCINQKLTHRVQAIVDKQKPIIHKHIGFLDNTYCQKDFGLVFYFRCFVKYIYVSLPCLCTLADKELKLFSLLGENEKHQIEANCVS